MRNHVIAMLLVASLAGCDLEAEAEAKSVCVIEPVTTQKVPGALGNVPVPPNSTVQQFPATFLLDIGSAVPDLEERGVTAELIARSLGITSLEGADFSGIESISVTLFAPGKPDVLFTYTRVPGSPVPLLAARATPSASVDLLDYLQNDSRIGIRSPTFSGRLPTTDWTPAVETCAASTVTVDYLEAAGL